MYKNFKNVKKSTKSDTITNVQSPTMIVKCRNIFSMCFQTRGHSVFKSEITWLSICHSKVLPEQVYCHDVKTLVALSCDFNILG